MTVSWLSGVVLGWSKGCNGTINFWDISLISKVWSSFPYFESLHHQFETLKSLYSRMLTVFPNKMARGPQFYWCFWLKIQIFIKIGPWLKLRGAKNRMNQSTQLIQNWAALHQLSRVEHSQPYFWSESSEILHLSSEIPILLWASYRFAKLCL